MPAKPKPLRPHEERQLARRRPPGEVPPGAPRPGDSFLIVTEGAVTEKLYFECLRDALRLDANLVRVVHPPYTDAEGLVRAAMNYYDQDDRGIRWGKLTSGGRDTEIIDHVWVLFDTDVPHRQGQLEPAMKLAVAEHIHVGHSTPSVELWLLLHFRDRPGPLLNSSAAEHAVGDAWGQAYEKSKDRFPRLWADLEPKIPIAVPRGADTRRYHRDANSPFPANPSTELDLLVLALNAATQPQLRIIS